MIPEPVPKDLRDEFIAADQDLFWLAEHGRLTEAAIFLACLRRITGDET